MSIATGLAGAAVAQSAQPALTSRQAYDLARETYLYAYPIVSMDATMRQATNVPDAGSVNMRAPLNQFAHARAYPKADEKDVVRFNFDTLYSFAWLDLSKEPVILSVPDTGERYYLLPMLDMWTDVFAVVGTRTTGNRAANYALVAPGWTGSLPEGVTRIAAPTPVVWILGRTKTDGPADYANVHKVQDGYRLTPLSQWGKNYQPPKGVATDPAVDNKTPPLVQVDSLDGVAMLTRLAALLEKHPPHPNDYPMLFRLRTLGIEPGKPFDPSKLDATTVAALNTAAKDVLAGVQAAWERTGKVVNGWTLQNDNIGTYGTSYLKRALVAKGGLGANLPEDAVYPTAAFDGAGKPLTGDNGYVLHFDKDNLPPADAFWSITVRHGRLSGAERAEPLRAQQPRQAGLQCRRLARHLRAGGESRQGEGGQLAAGAQGAIPADHAPLFPAPRGARRNMGAAALHEGAVTTARPFRTNVRGRTTRRKTT
ncbi:DUF1254 domain-containing protein [Roseixanthobacter psychrophilus]